MASVVYRFVLADALSCFAVLSGEPLVELISEPNASRYTFACNCILVRNIGEDARCQVQWCSKHRLLAPRWGGGK